MNRHLHRSILLGMLVSLAMAPVGQAQKRAFIGYAYPAGGQQGTTIQIKLGGQELDGVDQVRVTGTGVTGRIVEYCRRLGTQEVQLLTEQLKELKRRPAAGASMAGDAPPMMAAETPMMAMEAAPDVSLTKSSSSLVEALERRTRETVQTPACAALANTVIVEITIASDAPPGRRELRLITPRGVSNPLAFHVGQVPESSRESMLIAKLQVLGKEASALRKRPPEEAEKRITLPCTVNGQIASGEVNRYRFSAKKGQRLVLSTLARQLIPYVADAVPGWFQPVVVLYDAHQHEVAYQDDYRFQPDPVIFYQVPEDGEYVMAIHDSIYRGREDFVYRITLGELPYLTGVFPMGGTAGASMPPPHITGWGLSEAKPGPPPPLAGPGISSMSVSQSGRTSNCLPFAWDALPEAFEGKSNNNTAATAQKVTLPIIVNGRIERPDDWDVFQFTGKADDSLVIDVRARRLDSPLDPMIKLTDATGKVLAFNDDCEDLTAGANTHHADSYLMTHLPADGPYFIHIGDTARQGGDAYGYRLRLSGPRPDFELRVVPSSASLPIKGTAAVSVYAMRKDGFNGPIQVTLKDPPPGYSAATLVIAANQTHGKLTIKGGPTPTPTPLNLTVTGSATAGAEQITRDAVPAEDRMQAFLWRHLVPAADFPVLIFDPKYQAAPKRVAPLRPPERVGPPASAAPSASAAKPKFTKQQIVSRLRQLKNLYEEGLLTEAFYDEKASDCEAGQ